MWKNWIVTDFSIALPSFDPAGVYLFKITNTITEVY